MKKVLCMIFAVTLIICCFNMPSYAAGLVLKSANYPSNITEGSYFSVYGTISSDYTITSVTIGAYSLNGTKQFEYTVSPQANSFDVHDIDDYMTFSKLKAGSYYYKVVASDTYNKNVVLLKQNFTVSAAPLPPTPPPSEGFDKVDWDVIDISYWNEIYSWKEIANSYDGVIVRVGYRATVSHAIGADTQFVNFYNNAVKNGLHVGCYFFSAALSVEEAEEEAEYVISILKKNNCKMDMPIYFDMETEDQVDLTQSQATKIARAFCDVIEDNGYFPGIYCNKYFARDELYASQLSDITFWIAQYNTVCSYDGPYGMWQYSERGSIEGVEGDVDLNECYLDYPKYIRSHNLNGLSSSQTTTTKKTTTTTKKTTTTTKPTTTTTKTTITTKPTTTTTTTRTTTTTTQPKPTFSIKADGIRVDNTKKIVSRVAKGMTTDAFKSKYITHSSNVSVTFGSTVGGTVATGTSISFKNGSTNLATYYVGVIGDIDCNAVVNSSDALLVLEHVVGMRTIAGVRALCADCNDDGVINSTDALEILFQAVK